MVSAKTRNVAVVALLTFFTILPGRSKASGVEWRTDIRAAAALAEQSNRPMLLQITAQWCGYCHKMFNQTYSQASVTELVNDSFVCVKVDADENPELIRELQVRSLPTTVIVSPQMGVLKKLAGFQSATAMKSKLGEFQLASYAAPAGESLGRARVQQANITVETSIAPSLEVHNQADVITDIELASAESHFAPVNESPEPAAVPAPVVQAAREFAFDNSCLVSLISERRMIAGKPEYSMNFRGTPICFASLQHLEEFKANPELYWPMLDGRCAVSLLKDKVYANGAPEYGAVFRSRMWFFTSRQHMKTFIENPHSFLGAVQDRMASAK